MTKHIIPNYKDSGFNLRGPLHPASQVKKIAKDRGASYEFHEYGAPALNMEGLPWREYQSRHLHVFGTSLINPKGIALIHHGGGGDVGYADSPEGFEKCLHMVSKGFMAISVEYRRGWTDPGFRDDEIPAPTDAQWARQKDMFNLPAEQYKRQEEAARISFEDAHLALSYIRETFPAAYTKGLILEGTSFGAAICLELSVMNPSADLLPLIGVVAGFGGIAQKDLTDGELPSPDCCPVLLVGGAEDKLVPWWEGPYYCNGTTIGLGSGEIFKLINEAGGSVGAICTVNTGHGWGVVSEEAHEQFTLLARMVREVRDGSWANVQAFYEADKFSLTKVETTEEEALAHFAIRCDG